MTDKKSVDWVISSQASKRGRFRDYPNGVGAIASKWRAPLMGEDIVQPVWKHADDNISNRYDKKEYICLRK